jgi:hypothetical protein
MTSDNSLLEWFKSSPGQGSPGRHGRRGRGTDHKVAEPTVRHGTGRALLAAERLVTGHRVEPPVSTGRGRRVRWRVLGAVEVELEAFGGGGEPNGSVESVGLGALLAREELDLVAARSDGDFGQAA